MTWTPECHLTTEYLDDLTRRIITENKPICEQVITAWEAQEGELPWIAALTNDMHFWARGATEIEAIGTLWLHYPQKIIEHCKALSSLS